MKLKFLSVALVGAALCASSGYANAGCPTKGVTELTGAGATFPYPLYAKMFNEYDKACNVKVNYQSIGSGGGIQQLTSQTVDFGASDGIMEDKQQSAAKGGNVLHIPTVAGAEAVIVNLPNVQNGKLRLTGEVLAEIYLKKITNWNDAKIKAINPGMSLPDLTIAVVHRSDGSGTTYIFTNYLSKVSSEWKEKVGSATSVNWPGDVGGKGNEGVANSVKQIPGAIGYVELAFAKQNKMPWATLRNKAGKFLEPTLEGAAAAADQKDLPDNMQVMITDSANPAAYPISGFTWLLVYENQTDPAKGDAVANLVWWMIHEGQKFAQPLEYAPLKGVAVKKTEALVKKIKVNNQMVLK
jgi:phosphate transport system substrate-binding protein